MMWFLMFSDSGSNGASYQVVWSFEVKQFFNPNILIVQVSVYFGPFGPSSRKSQVFLLIDSFMVLTVFLSSATLALPPFSLFLVFPWDSTWSAIAPAGIV